MNSNFNDLLRQFAKHEVRHLIVGGYAAMLCLDTFYLSKTDLIRAKQLAGRQHDLADVEEMRRADTPSMGE